MGLTLSSVSVGTHANVPEVRFQDHPRDERVTALVEVSSGSASGRIPAGTAGSGTQVAGTLIQVSSTEPNGHMPEMAAVTDAQSQASVDPT